MKLIVIFGPPAVGKLTVAEEIAKLRDFKVFHNHMIIDLLKNFFVFDSTPFKYLSFKLKADIIEEASKNKVNLICTYVWNFAEERGLRNISHFENIVKENNGEIYFVELFADEATRKTRSDMEDRHRRKKALKSHEMSEYEKGRILSTNGDFTHNPNYLYIDNTNIDPTTVANTVIQHFKI